MSTLILSEIEKKSSLADIRKGNYMPVCRGKEKYRYVPCETKALMGHPLTLR